MKKILATIFALAMIFVFVSCDPINGSGNDNVVQLPDPIGEDPFLGAEKLIGSYVYNVDSTAKTIIRCYDDIPTQEFTYSYKVEGDKKYIYLLLTGVYDKNGQKYNVNEHLDFMVSIFYSEEYVQEIINGVKTGDETAIGKSTEILNKIKAVEDFDIEEVTAENVETIINKAIELKKEELKKEMHVGLILTYEIKSLELIGEPGVYEIVAQEVEGNEVL